MLKTIIFLFLIIFEFTIGYETTYGYSEETIESSVNDYEDEWTSIKTDFPLKTTTTDSTSIETIKSSTTDSFNDYTDDFIGTETTKQISILNSIEIKINESDLKCIFHFENIKDISNILLNKNISWFLSGENKSPELIYNSAIEYDNKKLYSILPSNKWTNYINYFLSCQIDLKEDGIFNSDTYYLGLLVNLGNQENPLYIFNNTGTVVLKLNEGDLNAKNLSIISTLPSLCDTNDCDIDISINLDNDLIQLNSDSDCYVSMNKKKSINTWSFVSSINLENSILNPVRVNLIFDVIVGKKLKDLLITELKLPQIKFSFEPLNRPYTNNGGSCYNDPHCYTNDGTPFEFQYFDGEYLMYENEKLQYRVHMVSEPCASWPGCGCNYCIRNIFVQSFDDFVSFDAKAEPSLAYIDLSSKIKRKIPIIWKDNVAQLPKSTVFRIIKTDYDYKIISHYGTGLVISKWGSFFQMIPSKLDKNRVFGLLGDYNGLRDDDLRRIKTGIVKNNIEFFEEYNVQKKNLPKFSKNEFYEIKPTTTSKSKFCKCQQVPNGKPQKSCKNGPVFIKTKNDRLKRNTENDLNINVTDLSYILNFNAYEKPIEVMSNVSSCVKVLNNNIMLKKCSELKIIDLNKLIEDCEVDFNSTQMDIWADYYLSTRKGWCKNVLEDDGSFYIEVNGKIKQNDDLIKNLCLNDCSNNGECVDGKCFCKKDYDGDDCSIDLKLPPRLKKTLFLNNNCDRQLYDCQQVSLLTDTISSNIKVSYNLKNQNTNLIDALQISDKILVTNLPKDENIKGLSVKNYILRVAYIDSTQSSNEIDYTIYDSKCHFKSNNEFKLKDNTCDIEGICYLNGDKNYNDEKLYCDSKTNSYSWTKNASIFIKPDILIISLFIIISKLYSN